MGTSCDSLKWMSGKPGGGKWSEVKLQSRLMLVCSLFPSCFQLPWTLHWAEVTHGHDDAAFVLDTATVPRPLTQQDHEWTVVCPMYSHTLDRLLTFVGTAKNETNYGHSGGKAFIAGCDEMQLCYVNACQHHNYQRGMEEKIQRNLVFLKSSCILILILFGWSKVVLERRSKGEGTGFSGFERKGETCSCGVGWQLKLLKLQEGGMWSHQRLMQTLK